MTREPKPEHVQDMEAALANLLFTALDDNVAILRHEVAIRRLANDAAPHLLEALVRVYEEGVRSGNASMDPAPRILDVFEKAVRETATRLIRNRIDEGLQQVELGNLIPGDVVFEDLRQRLAEEIQEQKAAGEDASLLRRIAREYDYRAEEALDEESRERANNVAERLRRLAEIHDHRNLD